MAPPPSPLTPHEALELSQRLLDGDPVQDRVGPADGRDKADLYVSPEEFTEGFGESIHRTLDVDTWRTGEDVAEIYRRIEEEVREAVRQEEEQCHVVRETVFPRLTSQYHAPPEAGVYRADVRYLEPIHHGL